MKRMLFTMVIFCAALCVTACSGQTNISAQGINKASTGPNEGGTPGQAFDAYWNCNRIWAQQSVPPDNNYCLRSWMDVETGGVDAAGNKSQFGGTESTVVKRTIGQASGVHSTMGCFAEGDCNGFSTEVEGWAGSNVTGNESAEAYRGDVIEMGTQFTATVTSTVLGVPLKINYGSAVNEDIRGAGRYIVDTTSNVSSAGTVSSISGTPPVIVGSGTSWASISSSSPCFSLGGAPCTPADGQLLFELTGCDNGATKYIVPIAAVTDNTHITLRYKALGVDQPWACATTSGSYKIYRGAKAGDQQWISGSIYTDSNGPNPAAFVNGDAMLMPVDYNYVAHSIYNGSLTYTLPPISPAALMQLENIGAYPVFRGIYIAGTGGISHAGIDISPSGDMSNAPLLTTSVPAGPLVASADITAANQQIARVLNSGSATRILSNYNRTLDQLDIAAGLHASTSDTRISTNSNPQPNTAFWLGYANAAWTGIHIEPTVTLNAGVPLFEVWEHAPNQALFRVKETEIQALTGIDGYSDAAAAHLKFLLSANTGNAGFVSLNIGNNGSGDLGGGTSITGHLSVLISNAAWDLSGAGVTCAFQDVTVTGAVANSTDTVAFNVDDSVMNATTDIVATAWIHTTNTVRVRLCDVAGTNPAAFTNKVLRVDVWKH